MVARRASLTPLARGIGAAGATLTPSATIVQFRNLLEPAQLSPPSAPASLAYYNFARLVLNTPPEQQRERLGLLAPLSLILRPLQLNEAFTWDAQWRGQDSVPSVSYYETLGNTPDAPIAKYFWDPTLLRKTPRAERSWTLFDARDRLICGGGGCNQPYGTWFAIAPAADNVYCSPDTLVSVLFQEPRYRTAQEALRQALASPPSKLPENLLGDNWRALTAAQKAELQAQIDAAKAEAARQPGYTRAAVDLAAREATERYLAQLRNEIIGNNAQAWAAWCVHVDALSRMAVWASNVRPELLYDWLDPSGSVRTTRTISSGSSPTGAYTYSDERRGFVGNPDSYDKSPNSLLTREDANYTFTTCHGDWALHRQHTSTTGSKYVRAEARRLDRAAGGLTSWEGGHVARGRVVVQEVFSSHLWNVSNNHRNVSRWLTHRYPLTATCFTTGAYTTGGRAEWANGGTWQNRDRDTYIDLPVRGRAVQIPMDKRYFAVDNTIPLPVLSSNYDWLAFSSDAWAQTPGAHSWFYDVPGVFTTKLACDESTLDQCVARTTESLRRLFALTRTGERNPWADQNNPVIARVRPVMPINFGGSIGFSERRQEGNKIEFAPYRRQERETPWCGSGPTIDGSGAPLPALDQYAWIPSPDSYVRGVVARAQDVVETSFGGMVARGTLMYADLLEFYTSPDRPWLSALPPGARPQDLRALAATFSKMEYDQAASTLGTVGGTISSAIGVVSGPVGALVAALVAVATELTARAQELKLSRGQNPITIPMAFVRFIEADAQNLLAECDFNATRAGYDATIPQVAVITEAAKEGWIGDALKLFGSLSEAVGSPDVPVQEVYQHPEISADEAKDLEAQADDALVHHGRAGGGFLANALPVAAVLAVGALLWRQSK